MELEMTYKQNTPEAQKRRSRSKEGQLSVVFVFYGKGWTNAVGDFYLFVGRFEAGTDARRKG